MSVAFQQTDPSLTIPVSVMKLAGSQFYGNVIPMQWLSAPELLVFPKAKEGRNLKPKPNLVANWVLADIVWWHRPNETRDERTGAVVLTKKFQKDKLRYDYADRADFFNFTKEQIINAIEFLEERGFIKREMRNEIHAGKLIANVVYIELNVDLVLKISSIQPEVSSAEGVSVNLPGGSRQIYREGHGKFTVTNPDITPDNTSREKDLPPVEKPGKPKPPVVVPQPSGLKDADEMFLLRFIDIWNEKCGVLPKVKRLTEDRRKKLRALIAEFGQQEAEELFDAATRHVASDPWYTEENLGKYGIDTLLAGDKIVRKAEGQQAKDSAGGAASRPQSGNSVRAIHDVAEKDYSDLKRGFR